jgi:hypothetical protein
MAATETCLQRVAAALMVGICLTYVLVIGVRLADTSLIVGTPEAVDYGEPIVYAQAARLAQGEALYQPLDRQPYTVTAYTPVYYLLAGILQAGFGPGFLAGRLLSLVAAAMASVLLASLVTRCTASRPAGVLVAIPFLALGFAGPIPWFAVYRVDVLGLAVSLAAVRALGDGSSRRAIVLAGLLAAAAVLTKQSFVAASLAGFVWLWTIKQSHAVLFAIVTGLGVVLPCLVLELTTHAFLANTLAGNVNPFNAEVFEYLSPVFSASLAPEIVCSVILVVVARPWDAPRTRLLLLYWIASAGQLVGLFKVGAYYNYWIEFAATSVALTSVAIWSGLRSSARSVSWLLSMGMCAGLIIQLVWVVPGVITEWSVATTLAAVRDPTRFQALVDRVRTAPGGVLADPLDVVVFAGRPVVLEPVIYSIFELDGRWNSEPLVRQICDGEISLLVLNMPIETASINILFGVPWWPTSVLDALRERMTLIGRLDGRFVYEPGTGSTPITTGPEVPSTTNVCGRYSTRNSNE